MNFWSAQHDGTGIDVPYEQMRSERWTEHDDD